MMMRTVMLVVELVSLVRNSRVLSTIHFEGNIDRPGHALCEVLERSVTPDSVAVF